MAVRRRPHQDRTAVRSLPDCERCRPRGIAQPVNTVSSLAYLVAGVVVARRGRGHDRANRALGLSLAGTGLGSVAFHASGGPIARRLHDATIVTTVGLVVAADATVLADRVGRHRRRRPTTGPMATPEKRSGAGALTPVAMGVIGLLTTGSRTTMTAQSVAGAALATCLAARWVLPNDTTRHGRGDDSTDASWRRHRRTMTGLWAAGLAAQLAGRSDSPFCRPGSALQPHAAWHILSAAALALQGIGLRPHGD